LGAEFLFLAEITEMRWLIYSTVTAFRPGVREASGDREREERREVVGGGPYPIQVLVMKNPSMRNILLNSTTFRKPHCFVSQ
jgi:hypothetical protein